MSNGSGVNAESATGLPTDRLIAELEEEMRRDLATLLRAPARKAEGARQLSLFTGAGSLAGVEDALSSASGEL